MLFEFDIVPNYNAILGTSMPAGYTLKFKNAELCTARTKQEIRQLAAIIQRAEDYNYEYFLNPSDISYIHRDRFRQLAKDLCRQISIKDDQLAF